MQSWGEARARPQPAAPASAHTAVKTPARKPAGTRRDSHQAQSTESGATSSLARGGFKSSSKYIQATLPANAIKQSCHAIRKRASWLNTPPAKCPHTIDGFAAGPIAISEVSALAPASRGGQDAGRDMRPASWCSDGASDSGSTQSSLSCTSGSSSTPHQPSAAAERPFHPAGWPAGERIRRQSYNCGSLKATFRCGILLPPMPDTRAACPSTLPTRLATRHAAQLTCRPDDNTAHPASHSQPHMKSGMTRWKMDPL